MTSIPSPDDSNPSTVNNAAELPCPGCGYDLRGIESERCPECGLLLDRAGMSISQIPWTHRKEMGGIRAFWKTCWIVFRRPGRIAADASRLVSFSDAKRFQRAVIFVACVPILMFGAWGLIANGNGNPFRRDGINGIISRPLIQLATVPMPGKWLGWCMEGFGVIFAAVCVWLFLKAITGVASYFFHPSELSIPRQNRAIALSYYACAALVWTPVTLGLYALVLLFDLKGWKDSVPGAEAQVILGLAFITSLTGELLAWWIGTLVLLKQTTRCSGARVTVAAIALPFLWIICGLVTLGVLPAAYVFVCVVIISLM